MCDACLGRGLRMRCKHVCLHKHKEEKQPSLRCNSEDECCLQSRQANAHWRERGQVSRKLVNINFSNATM